MSAIISDCGTFRYRLEREIGDGQKTAVFIMVNPSTADAVADDQTIRKVVTFSRNLGAGRLIVVNKFAFRAKDIKALRSAIDPIGPENDRHIEQALCDAQIHVAAWGPLNKLPPQLRTRWRSIVRVADQAGVTLRCFGTAQDGHPRHPCMLAYATPFADWTRP